MNLKKSALVSSILISLSLASTAYAAGESPWVPAAGSGDVGFSYGAQTADRFFAGDTESPLPDNLDLWTATINFSYGITDQLAFDANVGYASSDFLVNPVLSPQGGLSGITDSRFGLRYKAYEGDVATFTLNGALLVKGNYDTGAITAIGDGGSGIELSGILGLQSDSGFFATGELGYRNRNNDVPDEWYANVTGAYAFTNNFSGLLSYQIVRSNGDLNIGDPTFTPARFPEVDEDYDLLFGGVNLKVSDQWSLGAGYGRKLDGRNTAKSDFWNVSIDYSF
jgi:hypothetical protein